MSIVLTGVSRHRIVVAADGNRHQLAGEQITLAGDDVTKLVVMWGRYVVGYVGQASYIDRVRFPPSANGDVQIFRPNNIQLTAEEAWGWSSIEFVLCHL